jgi:bacterioferritin-associated ferredoxin
MNLDDTICYCFHVTKRKIANFLRVHRPQRASRLSECGGAGTGCGWCVPYLQRYFQEFQVGGAVGRDELNSGEYARLRAGYIRAGRGRPPDGAIPLPEETSDPP